MMQDVPQADRATSRRDQILDAAARVFAEKGFHPTTIRAVARAAGVADGTIYLYFENKTALLLGILDRMAASARFGEEFAHDIEGDMRGFLRLHLRRALLVPWADNFALFRVVISEILVNDDLRERYRRTILEPALATAEAHLQRWAAPRVVAPAEARLTVRVVMGVVTGLIVAHIMGDETLQARWEQLPDALADLLLDGIGGNAP